MQGYLQFFAQRHSDTHVQIPDTNVRERIVDSVVVVTVRVSSFLLSDFVAMEAASVATANINTHVIVVVFKLVQIRGKGIIVMILG